jgi:DNA-binding LacI/PurR family transcriptional regulator
MPDTPKPTIHDVAARAGVSRQTVSRVLNHTSYVSDSARERVLSAIRDLDYYPNPSAQALGRIGRTKPGPKAEEPERDA